MTNYSLAGNPYWETCSFYEGKIRLVMGTPSNEYYINFVIALILNIFLTISTIFLNSVTILAYMRSPFLKSKKSYYLIMLLSVNDLLVGLFANGSFVLLLGTTVFGYPICEAYSLFQVTSYILASMSTTTLFGLNIERYLSILYPFYHYTKVTKSKLLKMIVGFWFLTIAIRLPSMVLGKIMNILSCILFLLIAFLTLYMYISICVTVRRRPRVTETREIDQQATEARVQERRMTETREQQNIKMVKSCAFVVGVSFICNIPLAIIVFIPKHMIFSRPTLWIFTLLLSASSLNSLIFFWNNPVLRKEAIRLFKKSPLVI